jgi:hypothetical protein
MVELRRSRSRLRLSLTVWTLSLELARLSGWTPAGTRKTNPSDGEHADPLDGVRHLMGWQTEYRSSDGQTVAEADAQSLAVCLKKAAVEGARVIDDWAAGKIAPVPGIRTDTKGFRWFTSPEGIVHLENLAEFCRGGAFQIF